jgi:nitrogen regulatory protein P-II 1
MTETFNGRRFKIGLVPKVLLTIFAGDGEVEKITKAIQAGARTGKIGDGKIFVAPVENALRIRTGEEGALAI